MQSFYNSKGFKISELLFFYIAVPILVEQRVFGEGPLNKIIPLLGTCAVFTIVLLANKDYDNKNFIRFNADYKWGNVVIRFLVISVVAFFFVEIYYPELLFNFAEEKPEKFLIFLAVYPIISVIPQEIIYRGYFFYRYKSLFSNIKVMGVVNALLFGFLHYMYDNWLAVIGATLVGILFVLHYIRTKSLLNVVIIHYAYGILIFTVGLGKFFK
ncbi:MAG: CPBP family intramembrane glutamic endopeptidase [Candidatus Cyclobacteriaceae bacterium M2_1C_046]